jgi:folate-binding protein YgfZ
MGLEVGMTRIYPSGIVGYAEARSKAVYFSQADPGFLKIAGPDRSAFLQRQTTNDVSLLSEQKSVLTVLTNPSARILDVLRLVHYDSETIGVITLPGRGAKTANYLKSRIFFMDKVKLEDASLSLLQVELYGPASGRLLSSLGITHLPGLDEVSRGSLDQIPATLVGQVGFSGLGYRLLVSAYDGERLLALLETNLVLRLPSESYEVLRVETGLPAVDHELTDEYTPLEAGLGEAISGQKGCYTGQEVIARQVTYNKVTQHLVGLHLKSPAAGNERVWVDGKPVGVVTSHAISPAYGPIALAILRRPHHQAGMRVIISADGEGEGNPGTVAELPFRFHDQT